MTGSTKPWTQSPVAIFWVVTAVAFALRLLHIIAMSDPAVNPAFIMPVTDAGVHHRWAQGILAGTWPGPEPFFRAPLYPYFLSAVYAVFGAGNPLAAQIVHGMVSALGAGLAAMCSLRLWDTRAAWCAGLLFSALWSSIYFSGELLAVTASVTFNLWLLWLVLGPVSRRSLFFSGLVLGLSAITRPTVLVVVPVIVWYLWRRTQPQLRRSFSHWLWLGLGLVLTIGPVTMRNLVTGGEPVLIAASGGVNFYIGNNSYADGRVAFLPGAPPSWQGEMSDAVALATSESGHKTTALEADRYFWRQGLGFWQDYPGAALKLIARKAWLMLAAGERSNNKNLAFWRDRSPLLRWPVWPGWALVLGLAVLGFWRRDLKGQERNLVLGLVCFYAVALLLFFINARFRLPVMAWLVVPAGGGLAVIIGAARERIWSAVSPAALSVAIAIAAFSFVPDALTYHQDPATDFESWRMLGNTYFANGDQQRGLAAWEEALAIDAADPLDAHQWTLPQIYQPLVQMYQQQRRPKLAIALQRRWVARLPESIPARMGLADLLLQGKNAAEAIELLATLLKQIPDNEQAQLGYGWALHQAARHDDALAQFLLVAGKNPNPSAELGIGRSLLALDRLDESETRLLALLKAEPGYIPAYEDLAAVYARTGRRTEERKTWQKLLRQQPRHELARRRLAALQ